jgi:hypothetical protein
MFQEQFRTIVTDLRIGVWFATILPFGPPNAVGDGEVTRALAIKQNGGQTGDISGAFEQLAETAILLMAASVFHSGLQL